jgi:hypothetical protein
MDIYLTSSSLSLLVRLLLSHVIVDFLLQKKSWVTQKYDKRWKSPWLYIHGIIAGIVAYLFAATWPAIWIIPLVGITHILGDGCKSQFRDTVWSFIWDQVIHVFVIFVTWILLLNLTAPSIAMPQSADTKWWAVVLLYTIVIWPTGIFVQKSMESWQNDLGKDGSPSLQTAGLWIGRLERVLIVTFLLLNHFEAIGFLIAAKAVFRFGDTRDGSNRKETEYFLLGTLTSFTVAIILGVGTQLLLARL